MLVDVHAHLDDKSFNSDLDKVIERSKKNNVVSIINCGINPESNRKTLELANKYKIIKAALGLYPIDALKLNNEEIQKEIEFIKQNKEKIIALSEIGLDYKFSKENKKQKEIFLEFVSLAEKFSLPIIVHSRYAEKDIVTILESSKLKKIVFHCFNGDKNLIKRIQDHNWFFSIPPIIVRSEHFQFLVSETDINNLLTETDSPYLSPYFNKRNEPSFVKETIKSISEIKKIKIPETEEIILKNYKNIFLK